jgi:Rer1 family
LILNLFLRFLTPLKADLEEEELDNPVLPIRESDEFKPFLRKLGEYSLWKHTTIAATVAIICTFFKSLDLPVFWPVLVVYFFILFIITMRRQIGHMIKHRYLPFDIGKARYESSTEKR